MTFKELRECVEIMSGVPDDTRVYVSGVREDRETRRKGGIRVHYVEPVELGRLSFVQPCELPPDPPAAYRGKGWKFWADFLGLTDAADIQRAAEQDAADEARLSVNEAAEKAARGVSDREQLQRAMEAYVRRERRRGAGWNEVQQPSDSLSTVDGDRVTLRNVNGVLATCLVGRRSRVRWVEAEEVAA